MSDVQFVEDNNFSGERFRTPHTGGSVFVRFLVRRGIAKTEKEANYALVTVALCAFVASAFILLQVR